MHEATLLSCRPGAGQTREVGAHKDQQPSTFRAVRPTRSCSILRGPREISHATWLGWSEPVCRFETRSSQTIKAPSVRSDVMSKLQTEHRLPTRLSEVGEERGGWGRGLPVLAVRRAERAGQCRSVSTGCLGDVGREPQLPPTARRRNPGFTGLKVRYGHRNRSAIGTGFPSMKGIRPYYGGKNSQDDAVSLPNEPFPVGSESGLRHQRFRLHMHRNFGHPLLRGLLPSAIPSEARLGRLGGAIVRLARHSLPCWKPRDRVHLRGEMVSPPKALGGWPLKGRGW
ncbi:hypothetical protein GQ53DRAFT_551825 [Thozetella sp. PMI_491]|nr:hypothetical protein GQ53DRAFT_551825 [Thozetella sp. PMI_491]